MMETVLYLRQFITFIVHLFWLPMYFRNRRMGQLLRMFYYTNITKYFDKAYSFRQVSQQKHKRDCYLYNVLPFMQIIIIFVSWDSRHITSSRFEHSLYTDGEKVDYYRSPRNNPDKLQCPSLFTLIKLQSTGGRLAEASQIEREERAFSQFTQNGRGRSRLCLHFTILYRHYYY